MKTALLLLSSVFGLLSSSVLAASTNNYPDLSLGLNGSLTGGPGDLWRISGNFDNGSTNNLDYNILASTFEFTEAGAHNLEQASRNGGPCAGQISNNFAFGTLKISGGTVTLVDNWTNGTISNAVYAQTLTGTGTLNIGGGMVFYFGTTNGWSGTVNVTGNGIFRQYLPDYADTDGDGMLNWQECACGTEPTNSASRLRILSIVKTNTVDLRITWQTMGGKSYVLQTNAPSARGSVTTNFTDLSSIIFIPGSGEARTNYVDSGGATNKPTRYYRVRLAP